MIAAIYYIAVVLQWITLIYLPLCVAYFAIGMVVANNSETIWRRPLLGFHSFSTKTGSLIWLAQLIASGIVFYEFGLWYRDVINPFISF
jgi:hypothetical protein